MATASCQHTEFAHVIRNNTYYRYTTKTMANLTEDDKTRIRTTIQMFAKNVPDNMCKFYQNMMTDNPTYHPMFYHLKRIPIEEFPESQWIRTNQGPKVAGSIVDLVEKMEDLPALKESVHKLVVMPIHTKYALKAEDYLNVLKNALKTMRMCLGDKMTDEDANAWVKLVGQLMPLFEEELAMLPKKT